jgi:hypothetical protein
MGSAKRRRHGAVIDKQAALAIGRLTGAAMRRLDDPVSLHALLHLAEGVLAWISLFEPLSPATVVAAGSIGHRGIDEVLGFIDEGLQKHAPHVGKSGKSPAANPEKPLPTAKNEAAQQEAVRELSKTLNYYDFLRASLNGHRQYVPDHEYPYEHLPENTTWQETWEPADEETEYLVEVRFRGGARSPILKERLQDIQKFHDRIGHVSREVVQRFAEDMASGEYPASFSEVRSALLANPNAQAKAACRRLELLTQQIHGMVVTPSQGKTALPFGVPHQEFFVAGLVAKFVDVGQRYADEGLAVVGRNRSDRQSVRKGFLRRIGNVAQYAHLASGNGRYVRFLDVLDRIGGFAESLREDVLSLLPAPVPIVPATVTGIVNELNRRLVDPDILTNWRKVLGPETARIGGIIEAIVTDDPLQARPWTPGDHVLTLGKRGLLRRRGKKRDAKSEEVRDALFAMQHVGLAIQAPWEYVVGRAASLPSRTSKDGARFEQDCLPWIVNPLGSVLVSNGSAGGSVATRASRRRSGRKQKQGRSRRKTSTTDTQAVVPSGRRRKRSGVGNSGIAAKRGAGSGRNRTRKA